LIKRLVVAATRLPSANVFGGFSATSEADAALSFKRTAKAVRKALYILLMTIVGSGR
jgi:hypothetical protein